MCCWEEKAEGPGDELGGQWKQGLDSVSSALPALAHLVLSTLLRVTCLGHKLLCHKGFQSLTG